MLSRVDPSWPLVNLRSSHFVAMTSGDGGNPALTPRGKSRVDRKMEDITLTPRDTTTERRGAHALSQVSVRGSRLCLRHEVGLRRSRRQLGELREVCVLSTIANRPQAGMKYFSDPSTCIILHPYDPGVTRRNHWRQLASYAKGKGPHSGATRSEMVSPIR